MSGIAPTGIGLRGMIPPCQLNGEVEMPHTTTSTKIKKNDKHVQNTYIEGKVINPRLLDNLLAISFLVR